MYRWRNETENLSGDFCNGQSRPDASSIAYCVKNQKKRLNKCITRPCKFRSKFKCNNVKCNNKPNSFNKDWPWNVVPVLLLFFNGNRNILSVPTYWLNKFKKYFTISQIKIHVWAHLECYKMSMKVHLIFSNSKLWIDCIFCAQFKIIEP